MNGQPGIDLETAPPDPRERSDEPAAQRDAPWPEALGADAFYGVAGHIIRAIEPETEAHPAAMLVQLLAAFGNAVGTQPHFVADGARHGCKLFVGIVGATAKGRKGTSWARVRDVLAFTDTTDWTKQCVDFGLSSGEGLIWRIRDPIYKVETDRKTGETRDVLHDPGVSDKRLFLIEAELASAMATMARQGNTLSPTLRNAWDGTELRTLVKSLPAKATGAHVSIVGHVTRDELLRHLNRTELANGFANRFLWICAKRSKPLPFGGKSIDLGWLASEFRDALAFARRAGEVCWGADARPIWQRVYPELSDERLGIIGAVTGRAEAQVVRLAVLYSLLDKCVEIGAAHLKAALAVWKYAYASARWIWGDALGDPTADELLSQLRARPNGMTETEIRDYFGRHDSDGVGRARELLRKHGLARRVAGPSERGRPPQRWFAVGTGPEPTEATEATEGGVQ